MNIALAQLNFHIANFDDNFELIRKSIEKAQNDGVDLIVFSELAVCGYPPLDLLELKDFNDYCLLFVQKISKLCTNIAAIVGSPSVNPNHSGKKLYNSAFFLYQGKIRHIVHKALLPTYDVFDEYRYFEPCSVFNVIEFKGYRIALTICEDLWDDQPTDNPFGKTKLYTCSPMDELAKQNPDFIINIAASPFSYNKEKIKKCIFISKAAMYKLPLFYVNQVGANTELIFDGASMVINAKGEVISELASFQEDYKVYELESIVSGTFSPETIPVKEDVEKIHDALVLGIRDYFTKMGFSKAILGLSGGIDSALTLVLAVEAL
ncbi:MAG TPA: nitrilase-related carbon-nitrogen hydrolase, partial [Bacteroidales bacterium]